MKSQINDVMRISDKGYIDKVSDVRETVDDLISCKLDQLIVPGFSAAQMGHDLLDSLFLPSAYPQLLSFGELLNLIRVAYLHDNLIEWTALIKIFFTWEEPVISKVKLFAAVPIKALANLVDKKSKSEKGSLFFIYLYERAHNSFGYDLTKTTTIGQLLALMGTMTNWEPPLPISEFEKKTHASCEIIKILMIDMIRFAYPEMFVLSKLKDRLASYCQDWSSDKFDFEFGSRFDNPVYDFDVFATRGVPVENQQQEE